MYTATAATACLPARAITVAQWVRGMYMCPFGGWLLSGYAYCVCIICTCLTRTSPVPLSPPQHTRTGAILLIAAAAGAEPVVPGTVPAALPSQPYAGRRARARALRAEWTSCGLAPASVPPPAELMPSTSPSEIEPPDHAPMLLPTLAPCERACDPYFIMAPQTATPAASLSSLHVPAPLAAAHTRGDAREDRPSSVLRAHTYTFDGLLMPAPPAAAHVQRDARQRRLASVMRARARTPAPAAAASVEPAPDTTFSSGAVSVRVSTIA